MCIYIYKYIYIDFYFSDSDMYFTLVCDLV